MLINKLENESNNRNILIWRLVLINNLVELRAKGEDNNEQVVVTISSEGSLKRELLSNGSDVYKYLKRNSKSCRIHLEE